MKRLVVSTLTVGALFYLKHSAIGAILAGATVYFCYDPGHVPANVDNFPIMYIFWLTRRRMRIYYDILTYLGNGFILYTNLA